MGKKSGKSCEASPEFLLSVLNSLHVHVAVLDSEGGAIFRNEPWKVFARSCGVPPELSLEASACGEACKERPEMTDLHNGVWAVIQGEKTEHTQDYYCFSLKHWMRCRVARFSEEPKAGRVIVSREVVDEIKKAIDELNGLTQALEKSPAMVLVTNSDGEIEYVNQKFIEVTGYNKEEVLGKNARVLKPGDIAGESFREMWETIFRGEEWQGELLNKKKNGELFWESSRISSIKNFDGSIRSFVAVKEDISEKKRAEMELKEARIREVDTASRIQQELLIGKAPSNLKGFDVAAISIPSMGVDGDFFDFHLHQNICLDFLSGDVMGKGVPAALMGAAVKSQFLRSFNHFQKKWCMEIPPSPSEIADFVHQAISPKFIELETFVTLFFGRFSLQEDCFTYVNCGNPPGLWFQAKKRKVKELEGTSMPLGILESISIRQEQVIPAVGDVFLFFSDGVSEVRNHHREMFGVEKIQKFLEGTASFSSQKILSSLQEELEAFSGSKFRDDDLTSIVVKITAKD